jgi:hypothetical protein
MLSKFLNVLVLSPYKDDGELAAGGAIKILIDQDGNASNLIQIFE